MFWVTCFGLFFGFLSIGHITPLPNAMLITVLVLMIGIQFVYYCIHHLFYKKSRKTQPHYSKSQKLLTYSIYCIQFLLAFILTSSHSNHTLHQELHQRHFNPKQITTHVRVVGISQAVGERFRQIVEPIKPIDGLPKRWLLKASYQSKSDKLSKKNKQSQRIDSINQMRPSEIWKITANIAPPHGVAGQGLFSEQKWLLGMQVGATALTTEVERIQSYQQSSKSFFDKLANYRLLLRERIHSLNSQEAINNSKTTNTDNVQDKAVLLALLTGDTALISPETKRLYQQTGISHLLAISGPHVLFAASLFTWLLVKLLNLFPVLYKYFPKPYIVMPFALMVAVAYALLAGWELPAQRTVWMFAIATALTINNKKMVFWKIMLMSACIILYLQPLAVLSAGFWLSFIAVGLLVMIGQGVSLVNLAKWIKIPFITMRSVSANDNSDHNRSMVTIIFQKVIFNIKQFMLLQWVFFLCILPVSIFFFGEVSLLTPLVNLLAIPILGFIVVPLNIIAFLLNGISESLANGFWYLLLEIMHAFHTVLLWLVNIVPDNMIHINLDKTALWAWAMLIGLCLLPFVGRLRWLVVPLGLLIWLPKNITNSARVTVLDGTDFSAVLVQVKVDNPINPHKNLLYISDINLKYAVDYEVDRILIPQIQALQVQNIDSLIVSFSATHKDKKIRPKKHNNHNQASVQNPLDFIERLTTEFNVTEIMTNNKKIITTDKNTALKTLNQHALTDNNLKIKACNSSKSWQWADVHLKLLAPWEDVPIKGDDASCVLKISLNDEKKNTMNKEEKAHIDSVLLMGNASQLTQKMLLKLCVDVQADVLILPQQGNKKAYLDSFIDSVRPNYAVVGKKYSYKTELNYPDLLIRSEMFHKNIQLNTTSENGSIQYFLTDTKEVHYTNPVQWYRQTAPWLAVD